MKVYAVIGGWGDEGDDFVSLRLFDCRSTAVAYDKELTEVEGYDYAVMREQEVIMESLFSPQVEANLEALCQRLGC
jgi:hypothetical protein